MARKNKEIKELTVEEKLEQEKQNYLREVERMLSHIGEPTYHFNIGDKVRFGALKESIVDDILYDGKVYGLRCVATNNNYGKPYDYETYRVTAWMNVRPLHSGDSNFTKNKDIRLYFNHTTVESLIFKYYHFGVDMNPDYQRGYVWDDADKEFLIDSIFNNIDIGKFVLITTENWTETGLSYEVLDGKQRLSTLIAFFENRLKYKGKYYNDLSFDDQRTFKDHTISVAEVKNCTKKDVLKYFLMLNRTGKSMDYAQLDKVENMLNELESATQKEHCCVCCGDHIEQEHLSVCDKCASEYKF